MHEEFEAHCPRCDGMRYCDVHGSLAEPWSFQTDFNYHNGQSDHKLLQCRGCKTIFYFKSSWDSEDFEVKFNRETGEEELYFPTRNITYPAPEKKSARPDWAWTLYKIDITLSKIMSETYEAIENGSLILASVGLRTALDRASELLKIEPGHALEYKVKSLKEQGFIGETEALTLSVVVDAGNAAAHRAWAPDIQALKELLLSLEQFLFRTIVTGQGVLKVAATIPPRQARPKKKATQATP